MLACLLSWPHAWQAFFKCLIVPQITITTVPYTFVGAAMLVTLSIGPCCCKDANVFSNCEEFFLKTLKDC